MGRGEFAPVSSSQVGILNCPERVKLPGPVLGVDHRRFRLAGGRSAGRFGGAGEFPRFGSFDRDLGMR